jgi:small subunit ribosomal protein S35
MFGRLTGVVAESMQRGGVLAGFTQQVRWKSKRKKSAKFVRTPEQEAARGKAHVTLSQRLGNPESPYRVATNIRQVMARLTTSDKTQTRRRKDHRRYNVQRYLDMAKQTHHTAPYSPTPSNSENYDFMTNLTRLQHDAKLPGNDVNDYSRFPFPHTFFTKAFWGPPTVQDEPNANEGSMVGVAVAFRVADLHLPCESRDKLIAVVGDRRYDLETDVITIEADIFPDRNHNAAYLGDLLDTLLGEVSPSMTASTTLRDT